LVNAKKGNRFFSLVNIRAGEVIQHNEECGIAPYGALE
jgi:hypothetical protein